MSFTTPPQYVATTDIRTATVAIPAIALGAAVNVSITWATPFADSNYRMGYTAVLATGIVVVVNANVSAKTTTGATFRVTAATLLSAASATLDIIAIHD